MTSVSVTGRLGMAAALSALCWLAAIRDNGSFDTVGVVLASVFTMAWFGIVALGLYFDWKEQDQ